MGKRIDVSRMCPECKGEGEVYIGRGSEGEEIWMTCDECDNGSGWINEVTYADDDCWESKPSA